MRDLEKLIEELKLNEAEARSFKIGYNMGYKDGYTQGQKQDNPE